MTYIGSIRIKENNEISENDYYSIGYFVYVYVSFYLYLRACTSR